MSDITVALDDDGNGVIIEGAPEVVIQQPAQEAPAITDDPQIGIDDLRRQIDDHKQRARIAEENAARERQARLDSESRAANAEHQAMQARTQATDAQYESIVNALATTERELQQLQMLKEQAMERNDNAAASKLDVQMGKATARNVQLETAKNQIDEIRKQQPPVQQQQMQQHRSVEQEREAYLAQLNPRAANWIRSHPQYFTDPAFQQKVNGAAAYAQGVKGHDPSGDDYYRFIEEEVGLSQRAAPTPAPAPVSTAAVTQHRQSAPPPPVAAMAGRPTSAGPSNAPLANSNPNHVPLTPQEREIARILFAKQKPTDPDPEVAYARNKQRLQREGKTQYGRIPGT